MNSAQIPADRLAGTAGVALLMLGSHIDTAINAGIYDGCYGVLGGLEVAIRFAVR